MDSVGGGQARGAIRQRKHSMGSVEERDRKKYIGQRRPCMVSVGGDRQKVLSVKEELAKIV